MAQLTGGQFAYNPTTGQKVTYTAQELANNPALAYVSPQFQIYSSQAAFDSAQAAKPAKPPTSPVTFSSPITTGAPQPQFQPGGAANQSPVAITQAFIPSKTNLIEAMANDGKKFSSNSPEVIAYMNKFPGINIDAALGSVVDQYNRMSSARSTKPTDVAPPPAAPVPVVQTSDAERQRLRKEELARIKEELTGGADVPDPFKALEKFDTLRQEQGVVQDENELLAIQNEARLGQDELRRFRQTAGFGVTEGSRIGAISEAERNLNFRLEGLALREQAVLGRLNAKNAYIETALKYGQQDYQNALASYEMEYNLNLKTVELYNQELEIQKKDAMAGLTTITNLLKEQNIDFNAIDPALRTEIKTLELKAGLPSGITESIFTATPQAEIAHFQKNDDGTTSVFYKQNGKIVDVETFGEPSIYGKDTQIVKRADGSQVLIDSQTGEEIAVIDDGTGMPGLTDEQRELVLKLRNEMRQDPVLKDLVEIENAKVRIDAAIKSKQKDGTLTPAGDLSLIFAYMKLLDPTSVVREGEFATAENTRGVPDTIRNIYNKVIEGNRLNATQVVDFSSRADDLLAQKMEQAQGSLDSIKRIAEGSGIPLNLVSPLFDTAGGSTVPSGSLPVINFSPKDLGTLENTPGYEVYSQIIDQYRADSPKATPDEILRAILEDFGSSGGFSNELSSSVKGSERLTNGRTSLALGSGTITGINGSSAWKWGLDFVLDGGKGALVKSPVSGTVIASTKNGGFGNQVKIRLDDGREVWISHLDALNVKKGQKIKAGTLIGKQGNTGTVLGGKGEKLTSQQIAGGRGTHLDITIKKPGGGYYTAREVAAMLNDQRLKQYLA